MSRKYKMNNAEGIYFVSFATVYWIDVFVREIYFEAIIQALAFCCKEKGMILYGYCIMPSHIHLLFQAKEKNPIALLQSFKKFTAKGLLKLISENQQESRKEWLLWMFERAGKKRANVQKYQFWQHHNQPIEIYSEKYFDQKLDYIHQNPVLSGFVSQAEDWKYSSAKNYVNCQDIVLEIEKLI
ncbi:TPA: transposase [Pasteurella multocida]|nr:transposase [Pasteurella multocida]AWB52291.1 transposase [Pasteurella multocida]MEB3461207.1 transposase [Pasteurella multocida]MEB3478771.1 transposase [Pasteurella multocida]MEB3493607.1 transposase [Pasteurella multocida]PNM02930.1 transposase [Pasteurella multocida]